MKKEGYSPVVFCCNAKHSGKKELFFDDVSIWSEHIAEEIDTPFVYVRGRMYSNNGKERLLNMVDFYLNLKKAAIEYAEEMGSQMLF